ncbi:MAG: 50S ribosomal protein L35 [Candidatus Spechtbacterales bacterium]
MAKQKLKTRKSVTKRFKVTATGKLLHRRPFQGHFNAKDSGKQRRQKRRMHEVAKPEVKILKKLMPYA